MSQPVVALITLAGEPGAVCDGDDCTVLDSPRPDLEPEDALDD